MTNISELPEQFRKFVRRLVRIYCRKNQLYKQAHIQGMGIEETEEAVEKELDNKTLFIQDDGDEENPTFWITSVVK